VPAGVPGPGANLYLAVAHDMGLVTEFLVPTSLIGMTGSRCPLELVLQSVDLTYIYGGG